MVKLSVDGSDGKAGATLLANSSIMAGTRASVGKWSNEHLVYRGRRRMKLLNDGLT